MDSAASREGHGRVTAEAPVPGRVSAPRRASHPGHRGDGLDRDAGRSLLETGVEETEPSHPTAERRSMCGDLRFESLAREPMQLRIEAVALDDQAPRLD